MPTTSAGAFINYSVLMGKTVIDKFKLYKWNKLLKSAKFSRNKSLVTSKKFMKTWIKGINIKEILDMVEVIYLEDLKLKSQN